MKNLLIVSAIILGTFASVGAASAANFSAGYPGWAQEAFSTGNESR